MVELSTVDSTCKMQARRGGAPKLGVKECVRVPSACEGGKGTPAEGTGGCAKARGQERAWYVHGMTLYLAGL